MVSDTLRQAIRGDVLKHRLLWAALVGAIGTYCAIAVIAAHVGREGTRVSDSIRWALMGAGYSALAGAFIMRRMLLSPARVRELMDPPVNRDDVARNPSTGAVDEKRLELLGRLSEAETGLLRLAGACFVPYLISLALVDTCAIIGLVLAIVERDVHAILPFAIPSGVAALLLFPNIEGFLEKARLMGRL